MKRTDGGEEKVVPLRPRRKCPTCGRPATGGHRPFCSRRCADLDLARWLGGGYRIATDEAPGEGAHADREE